MFSDGFSMFTATPAATIELTPGTDENPQTNYIYILKSSKVLAISTSDWPAAEHIKIAQICLQSAATTQTVEALRNHNWNDHVEDTTTFQGHLSHITEAVRNKNGATWWSGVEGTLSINTTPTPDDVTVAVTSGMVYQLRKHSFSAMDTNVSDDIHVVNHSATPYVTVTNLNSLVLDANGDSIENQSFSFVLWAVQNSGDSQNHLMLNLPIGSYSFAAPENAETDALNYAVYDIPKRFRGVGFLIAKFNLTYKNDSWVLYSTQDLRERTGSAGGGGGTGVASFSALLDTPNAYTDQGGKLVKVNDGESALEFSDSGWTASSNVDVDTGTEIVDSFDPEGDGAVTWHFYVASNDGANARAGTIVAHWDDSAGGDCDINEVNTGSRGDTSPLTLAANMDGAAGNVRLMATATSDNWTVRAIRTPII
jgi:hypothetical protein